MKSTTCFNRYWSAYGGFPALLKSGYLLFSLVFTLFCAAYWLQYEWWDLTLSIMPNILGFSLGGYAMWLAIGNDNFRDIISGDDVRELEEAKSIDEINKIIDTFQERNESDDFSSSPYIEYNAAFVHFIIMQAVSILYSLLVKSLSVIPCKSIFSLWSWLSLLPVNIDNWVAIIVLGLLTIAKFFGFFIFVYALSLSVAATMAIFGIANEYNRFATESLFEKKLSEIIKAMQESKVNTKN